MKSNGSTELKARRKRASGKFVVAVCVVVAVTTIATVLGHFIGRGYSTGITFAASLAVFRWVRSVDQRDAVLPQMDR